MSNGKMPDLGELMKMAQKLQGDVSKAQAELEKQTCEAAAGGGMVVATVNGKYEVVDLKIDKEVVDPNDIDMLRDLIVAAINQAIVKVRDLTQSEMSKLTGGLGIPGMPKF